MNNPISPEQAIETFKQAGGIVIDGCAVGISATDLANAMNLAITKCFGEPVKVTGKLGTRCMFTSTTVRKGESFYLIPADAPRNDNT